MVVSIRMWFDVMPPVRDTNPVVFIWLLRNANSLITVIPLQKLRSA